MPFSRVGTTPPFTSAGFQTLALTWFGCRAVRSRVDSSSRAARGSASSASHGGVTGTAGNRCRCAASSSATDSGLLDLR
jgi:hypothetical protein